MRLFIIATLLLIITSCSKNDDNEYIKPISHLEDLGCDDLQYNILNFVDTFKVITTQAEFDSLKLNNCDIEIDFNTYDLIIGSSQFNGGIYDVSYRILQNLSIQERILQVKYTSSITFDAPLMIYSAIIPKLKDNEKIIVEVYLDDNLYE